MRFTWRQWLVFILVTVFLSVGVRALIVTNKRTFEALDAFGAVWQTHDMLMVYMEENNGNWPKKWGDLQPAFSTTNQQSYGAPDLQWLRDRVVVDFGFDSNAFATSGQHQDMALCVLRLRDGSQNRETQDANERIKQAIMSGNAP